MGFFLRFGTFVPTNIKLKLAFKSNLLITNTEEMIKMPVVIEMLYLSIGREYFLNDAASYYNSRKFHYFLIKSLH